MLYTLVVFTLIFHCKKCFKLFPMYFFLLEKKLRTAMKNVHMLGNNLHSILMAFLNNTVDLTVNGLGHILAVSAGMGKIPADKYLIIVVSRPILSDMPYLVTIALASLVARLISLEAPVVMSPKISSSATRPPRRVVISWSILPLVLNISSFSGRGMVYPAAPIPVGIMEMV